MELRSNAGTRAGGDLYEVVHTPFGVRAIIGDVAGYGPEAIGLAAEVLTGFRELALHETGIAGIAFRIDAFLSLRDDQPFVTAVLVQFAPDGSYADLVCCGHPPPLVLRGGRTVSTQDLGPALPLGLQDLDSGWYSASWLPLQPGDAVLLYSGGVTGGGAPQAGDYPIAERAARFSSVDPARFLDRLESDLLTHLGGKPPTDVTLLYLRPERDPAGRSPAPPLRIPALGPEWPDRPL